MTDAPQAFQAATAAAKELGSADRAQKMLMYGLYKQATSGPCDGLQPGGGVAALKFSAWKMHGDMAKEEAMGRYAALVESIQAAAQAKKLAPSRWRACCSSAGVGDGGAVPSSALEAQQITAGSAGERTAAYTGLEATRDIALAVACVGPLGNLLTRPASEIGESEFRRVNLVLHSLSVLSPMEVGAAWFRGDHFLDWRTKGNVLHEALSKPWEQWTKEDGAQPTLCSAPVLDSTRHWSSGYMYWLALTRVGRRVLQRAR